MTAKFFRLIGLLLLIFILLAIVSAADLLRAEPGNRVAGYSAKGVRLDQKEFVARGYNETLLHITRVGRYSIQVKSKQGTRIRFIDRMGGQVDLDGEPGEKDGRIDLFLDKGTYKIRLDSHSKGEGKAVLNVFPFQNVKPVKRPEDLPFVPHLDIFSGQLGDLQQYGFWIHITKRKTLRLEMIGRNLKSALLWRDGSWLEDIKPTVTETEPEPGRPMTYIEFHHELNPGLYLLQCYGGPERAWARDIGKNSDYVHGRNPFHLREGISYLGRDGQHLTAISPFGRDVFEVHNHTDFLQLVRRDKKKSRLTLYYWSEKNSRFYSVAQYADINKKSRDPWCVLQYNSRNRKSRWYVCVSAQPGDGVELDFFQRRYYSGIKAGSTPQRYFVSSIHSARGRDAVDVTALLATQKRKTPLSHDVIQITPDEPVIRRVNLLEEFNVYLYFEQGGAYVIDEDKTSGGLGKYQFKPFLLSYPRKFKAPEFRTAGSQFQITPGFHVLTVKPASKGILHFALYKKSPALQSRVEARFNASPKSLKTATESISRGLVWPEVVIPGHSERSKPTYYFYMNQRGGVPSGIVIRSLPVDLTAPLPIILAPGKSVLVQIKHDKKMKLDITGGKYNLTVDKIPWTLKKAMSAGPHFVYLENTDKTVCLYNLYAKPAYVPPVPAPVIKPIEKIFPVMTQKSPIFTNFTRGERKEFILKVKSPGLYRLETTGRLATRITVRTRTVISMFSAEKNGIGRNALVQQYLKPGDYLVNVIAIGSSAGRAGIFLRKTPLRTGEDLVPGVIKREYVPPDAAVRYAFTIPASEQNGEDSKKKGVREQRYRLLTYSLGKHPPARLEDAGGWPLTIPGGIEEINRLFRPGTYYYYTLPIAVESRRLTFLENIPGKLSISGKGPHAMTVNQALENTWMEDDQRAPDVYSLSVPSTIKVKIYTNNKMVFRVVRVKDQKEFCRDRNTWQEVLPAGQYRILCRAKEKNNRLSYPIIVSSDELAPGIPKTIGSLPRIVDVRLDREGLVDISSFGNIDVKARLTDMENKVIASSDDRSRDWNPYISRNLPAGRYRLHVESADTGSGEVKVSMHRREILHLDPQTLPFAVKRVLKGEVLRIPFKTGDRETLLDIDSSGNRDMALALYKGKILLAESGGFLYIPLRAKSRYTLLVWNRGDVSSVGAGVKLRIYARPLYPPDVNAGSAGTTVTLKPAVRLADKTGHSFYIQPRSHTTALYYSPLPERPCLETSSGTVETTSAGFGWLAVRGKHTTAAIRPVVVPVSRSRTLKVSLNEEPLTFTLDARADAPILLTVKSIGVITGASLFPVSSPGENKFNPTAMVAVPSRTLAAVPQKGKYLGYVWLTGATTPAVSPEKRARQAERLTLDFKTFPPQEPAPLDLISQSGIETPVAPGKSVSVALPGSPLLLEVTLTDGLVAFAPGENIASGIIAADGANCTARMTVTGSRLYILNTQDRPTRFRIRKSGEVEAEEHAFTPGEPFIMVPDVGGKLEFQSLPAIRKIYIFVAGVSIKPRLWESNGKINNGVPADIDSSFPVHQFPAASGFLEISHDSGPVVLWSGKSPHAFTGPIDFTKAVPVREEIPLSPESRVHAVTLDSPAYISLETATPSILALISDNSPGKTRTPVTPYSPITHSILRLSAGPVPSRDSPRLHRVEYDLPAGTFYIWSRILPGLHTSGKLAIKKITPVQLDEGKTCPIRLIGPNEIQVYRFIVYKTEKKSRIGIGLETETDRLNASLYRESRLIADGPLMFENLEPGSYLLVVRAREIPVQYRPVLLGNRGSRTGIPDDVVEKYEK